MTCLSPQANNLRAAVMLANDVIYREENKNEYQSGAEVFVFSRNATEVSFVQIGQPHVFLHRKSKPLIRLGPPNGHGARMGGGSPATRPSSS